MNELLGQLRRVSSSDRMSSRKSLRRDTHLPSFYRCCLSQAEVVQELAAIVQEASCECRAAQNLFSSLQTPVFDFAPQKATT